MNRTWGYRTSDNNWKTTETLIRNLVDIASKGGNYLLNIGPKPDGTFPQPSIERLAEIGQWMRMNGESIYRTQASPFGLLPWGRCTQREESGNTVLYVSVFDWPESGRLELPDLKNEISSATLLAGGQSLLTSVSANGATIDLPKTAPDPIASVIKLVVNGKVASKIDMSPRKEMNTGALD
jgi:alpha-L-fucosidase